MLNVVVVGATGEVGRAIVATLLQRGHRVVAVARDQARLARLGEALGQDVQLTRVCGSVASDPDAARLVAQISATLPQIDAAILSVNAPRQPASLLTYTDQSLSTLINGDLLTHFCAAREFAAVLHPGGTLLGIGGGSCDFVLHDGIPQSMAQAALRMLYRGLAHEHRDRPLHVHELIVASIVNSESTRRVADPLWVTDTEIAQRAAHIIEQPADYIDPILRLARRDISGQPVFSSEGPSRVQGFR
jgi:NAD(P)-dependent dehydrogenase (short-subunit alcohol dehydrogenase family)